MKTMIGQHPQQNRITPMRRATNRLLIGPNEDAILRALARYHYLVSRQVCRLLGFSPKSIEHVQGLLKRLADAGYLERIVLPHRSRAATGAYTRGGMGPFVFTLARKGQQYLAAADADADGEPPRRARPGVEREHSYLFLTHTLQVAELLIAAERLGVACPTVEIAQLLHERDLRRTPTPVRITGAARQPVEVAYVPDGYLDLHVYAAAPYRSCLGLEIDRGTEGQAKWRRKVQAIIAYQRGPYQQAFGTDVLTVCVIATPGAGRLRTLVDWTEAELTEMGRRPDDIDLFRFAALPLDLRAPEEQQPSPAEIFLSPRWSIPFGRGPVPLLDALA
jgi:hypothetical protein